MTVLVQLSLGVVVLGVALGLVVLASIRARVHPAADPAAQLALRLRDASRVAPTL
jgi:hypothetical protein